MANCECGVNDPWLVSIASAIVEQIRTLGTRLGLCVAVPCCDPSCREVLFLSLCVGCFCPHTVLCVLGKHSGSHTCILCVVMVAPPPPLCFILFPLPPLSSTPLFPLPLLFDPSLPIHFNSSPSCHSPPHINPSTTHFSSFSFLSLHPPPLSLLSYPVGPSLSAGNSVWNRPVCGAGCLLCASHPLRPVSWPPLISGDYITVCISVQELTQWPSLWITHR